MNTFGQCYRCKLSLPHHLLKTFIAKLRNGQVQKVQLCHECFKIIDKKTS
jgi:hypothetical protein